MKGQQGRQPGDGESDCASVIRVCSVQLGANISLRVWPLFLSPRLQLHTGGGGAGGGRGSEGKKLKEEEENDRKEVEWRKCRFGG